LTEPQPQTDLVEVSEQPTLPERIGQWVLVPIMLGIIAIGFAAVCLRFLFGGHYALFWSEEVIRYAFIWLFWLAAPILVWRGAMFSVDLVVASLPPTLQRLVQILCNLGIMFLMSIYVWYGWQMTWINAAQESSALRIPLSAVYLAIPVGSALIVLAVLVQTVKLVLGFRREKAV